MGRGGSEFPLPPPPMGVGIPLPTPKLSGTYGFPLSLPSFLRQVNTEVGEIHTLYSHSKK